VLVQPAAPPQALWTTVARLSTGVPTRGRPTPSVLGVTATDFAVSITALRRAGALLADLDPVRAPATAVDPGRAATTALDSVVAAATDRLTALDTRAHALADAFDAAARAYEWCDQEIAEWLR
jgi:hypothetical protein